MDKHSKSGLPQQMLVLLLFALAKYLCSQEARESNARGTARMPTFVACHLKP